jgi:hypothetical protein
MTWKPASAVHRRLADAWCLAAGLTVLCSPVWGIVRSLVPGCTARALTGVPCPGCGATRALSSLLSGHPLEALSLNPLASAAVLAALAGGLIAPVWVRLARTVPVLIGPLPRKVRAAAAAALLLNWVYLVLRGI